MHLLRAAWGCRASTAASGSGTCAYGVFFGHRILRNGRSDADSKGIPFLPVPLPSQASFPSPNPKPTQPSVPLPVSKSSLFVAFHRVPQRRHRCREHQFRVSPQNLQVQQSSFLPWLSTLRNDAEFSPPTGSPVPICIPASHFQPAPQFHTPWVCSGGEASFRRFEGGILSKKDTQIADKHGLKQLRFVLSHNLVRARPCKHKSGTPLMRAEHRFMELLQAAHRRATLYNGVASIGTLLMRAAHR